MAAGELKAGIKKTQELNPSAGLQNSDSTRLNNKVEQTNKFLTKNLKQRDACEDGYCLFWVQIVAAGQNSPLKIDLQI